MGSKDSRPTVADLTKSMNEIRKSEITMKSKDLSQITENLYLTCFDTAQRHHRENRNQKDEFVYISVAFENPFISFDCKRFEWMDDLKQQLFPEVEQVADLIHSSIQDEKTVILFCFMGVSRSASAAIFYLMKYHDQTFTTARDFVTRKRSIICPNDSFAYQLSMYNLNK
jgi:protein-tyrosine phosphatase